MDNIDYIKLFNTILNSKYNKNINKNYRLLDTELRRKSDEEDYILAELLYKFAIGGYDKKYDKSKSTLLHYISIFVDSTLMRMIDNKMKKRGNDMYNKSNTSSFDDEINYGEGFVSPEAVTILNEKRHLLLKYAKSKDRLFEAKIILGEVDFFDFVEEGSKKYDRLRQRVSRLKLSFEDWYEKL